MTEPLTQEALRSHVRYDPITGKFTRVKSGSGVKAGDPAERLHTDGYLRIAINKVRHYAHRLAWLDTHGRWPEGHVDHINGCRTDNRLCNLREVSASLNAQNQRRPHTRSSTGFLGVTKRKRGFVAQIEVNRKTRVLGTFPTAEEAHERYLQAKREMHAGCTI